MEKKKYSVTGIGNAIVDVVAQVPEAFIIAQQLTKSSMTLINREKADSLYNAMPPAIECSGGSAANTIAGIASLGGRAAFIGKVADDQLGRIFTHDLRSLGVHYATEPTFSDGATARCLVSVTPDAERTMATYLGDNVSLTSYDIAPEIIEDSEVLYIEGYLWDDDSPAKQAILEAMNIARNAGVQIAFSLSDAWCVDRHRHGFLYLLEEYIDILFANEQEILALLHVHDFETAVRHVAQRCEMAALTQGAKGSVVIQNGRDFDILPEKDITVVDTTGAGDLYASGFLYAITQGYPAQAAGELATISASHIISQLGARPRTPLAALNPFKRVA